MLSNNAYAVYLIHILLIIYLQMAVVNLSAGPLAKFSLVVFLGTPMYFILSDILRKLPFVKFVVA